MRGLLTARTAVLALALAALFGSACGRQDRVPVQEARGRVLCDGKPLGAALVALHPVGNTDPAAPHPIAYSDKDGTFSLTSYDGKDGAPPGEYVVTVEWRYRERAEYESAEIPRNRLPIRFSNPTQSPLRVRIDSGASDLGDLKVTSR
jgi:hypothetical protein